MPTIRVAQGRPPSQLSRVPHNLAGWSGIRLLHTTVSNRSAHLLTEYPRQTCTATGHDAAGHPETLRCFGGWGRSRNPALLFFLRSPFLLLAHRSPNSHILHATSSLSSPRLTIRRPARTPEKNILPSRRSQPPITGLSLHRHIDLTQEESVLITPRVPIIYSLQKAH